MLFEGGAGETVRRKLMNECELHTVMRLPTGIFYAQGVKANVLFFDRRPASETPWTKTVWFYDFRTNMHFTLKQNRLARADLDEFVACFNPANRHERKPTWSKTNPEGRWRPYSYDEINARDKASLDIFWLRDESLEDSASLPDPHILAAEIAEDLRSALEEDPRCAPRLTRKSGRLTHAAVTDARGEAQRLTRKRKERSEKVVRQRRSKNRRTAPP